MTKRKLSTLNFYVLNTRNPDSSQIQLVEDAFTFWQKSWSATFKSLNVDLPHGLPADDFLDREALALFEGKKPVALFFSSQFSTRPTHFAHSYFHNYPRNVLNGLKEQGLSEFMTLSYMTCDPDYRKNFTDVPMAELLFSLGVLRFLSSSHELLLGYIRKDLSFHKVFENHGGELVQSGHAYNVPVDFMTMTRNSAKLSPVKGVADTANILWEKAFSSRHLRVA